MHIVSSTIKLAKCALFTHYVRYLGYLMEPGRLSIDETVSKDLREAKSPRNKKLIRYFCGLFKVYKRFFFVYTNSSVPLNFLLCAYSPYVIESLTRNHTSDFMNLTKEVTSPAMISLSKNCLPYSLDTDSSGYQFGAALFQKDEDNIRRSFGFPTIKIITNENITPSVRNSVSRSYGTRPHCDHIFASVTS